MPESPRMFMLLGLAQTRISEFHTELEAIGSQNLKNVYINHPVSIEQALMEGSYNKVSKLLIENLIQISSFLE